MVADLRHRSGNSLATASLMVRSQVRLASMDRVLQLQVTRLRRGLPAYL